jgi:hypothetical protein
MISKELPQSEHKKLLFLLIGQLNIKTDNKNYIFSIIDFLGDLYNSTSTLLYLGHVISFTLLFWDSLYKRMVFS